MTRFKLLVKISLSEKVRTCDMFINILDSTKKGDPVEDAAISKCIEIIKAVRDLLQQGVDHVDQMCPNCSTPWKCDGPHIPPGIGRSYPVIYKALLRVKLVAPNPEKSVLTLE